MIQLYVLINQSSLSLLKLFAIHFLVYYVNIAFGSFVLHLGNILFHLNPRFDQQYVALNSKQNGSWTTEEGIQDFQFSQGVHFDLTMLISEQEVTVSFNRKHFTDFKHRLKHIQAFRFIVIEGDVVISSIRLHKA